MKETVKALAEQVARGKLDPAIAGRRMRGLLSNVELARTDAEKREKFNEAAYETDPNSFVHVMAMNIAGDLSDADYAAIRRAVQTA